MPAPRADPTFSSRTCHNTPSSTDSAGLLCTSRTSRTIVLRPLLRVARRIPREISPHV